MLRKKIQFTREGYQKVKDDLANLSQKRQGAVITLRTAREMGDLSENGAYKAARFELSSIDRELRRLTYLLRFGRIGETKHTGVIGFGNKVILTNDTKTIEFTLVEGYESDPRQHKISVFSPLGKAVIGKRKDDTVTVLAPTGQHKYIVERVE